MPFEGEMKLFSVQTYMGKNGQGANIVFINESAKGKLEVNTGNADIINKAIRLEGTDVILKVKITQSRFGERVEIIDIAA